MQGACGASRLMSNPRSRTCIPVPKCQGMRKRRNRTRLLPLQCPSYSARSARRRISRPGHHPLATIDDERSSRGGSETTETCSPLADDRRGLREAMPRTIFAARTSPRRRNRGNLRLAPLAEKQPFETIAECQKPVRIRPKRPGRDRAHARRRGAAPFPVPGTSGSSE
jgi:hypothetical protein